MTLAPGFSRFELLTAWLPLAVVIGGLLLVGALLAVHPDELGPVALVFIGGCTAILLLALWVLVLGWL